MYVHALHIGTYTHSHILKQLIIEMKFRVKSKGKHKTLH